MRMFVNILVLVGLFASFAARSAFNYQSGRISNLTTVTQGVMIMLDSGLPDNCVGAPYGWMLIPETNKAMTALVLGMWLNGTAANTPIYVYTNDYVPGNYCVVNQVDP